MNTRRRLRNVGLTALGLVAAYAVIGFLVVPPVAKKLIVDNASTRLGRPVALDKVRFNPFTLEARLEGFRILEGDGKTVFASFDTLEVDGSAASIYHRAPVIEALTLAGMRVHAVRDGDTHYNFTDILERLRAAATKAADNQPANKKESEPARFSVGNIRVVDAAVDFDDRPNHAKHVVDQVQLGVPFISNLPTHVHDRVQPGFSARIDGSPMRVTGETQPFEDTMRTHFNLELRTLDVPKYMAYVPAELPVHVDSGKLDAVISLRFAQKAGRDTTIEIAGKAVLSDVALSTAEGALTRFAKLEADVTSADPLAGLVKVASVHLANASAMQDQWKIGALDAQGIDVDLRKHTVRVASVATSDGNLTLTRAADHTIALPHVETKGPPTQWDIALAAAKVTGYNVIFVDNAVQPAVTHRIALASLDARDLATADGLKGSATIQARLERGGSLDASANFALAPLNVKATIDARSIDITPYRAYVAQFPAVAVKSGVASAKGTITLAGSPDALRIGYDGAAEVDRLATYDTLNKEDLLNWKSVKTRGIKVDLPPAAPLSLAVADITVEGAYSRIFLNPQGKLNVQQLISATDTQPQPAPAAGPPNPRNIRIDRITFADSRLNFTDHYIRPNYTADVGNLHGSVTKLSSDPAARAIVALEGRWDSSSPVLIAGTVNPLRGDLFLDVAARGKEIDLTKLTAYSERYAGYGLKEGRLTLDVKYHVDNGKLEGRNRIVVDQLAFGDKVDSPDATKLPVLFAVNLLKDKNGRIDLELPISGSLEDPKFEIGAVIGQVFSSRIEKAESSPFSLIGGADGGDELAYVEFEPGTGNLTPEAQKKLDTLAQLLQDRPGLKLALAARLDTTGDIEAMKAAIRQQRLAAAPKDLSKEAREKLEKEPVEVPAEAQHALIEQRDQAVRSYLVEHGQMPEDRIVVVADPFKAKDTKAKLSRVDFALR